MYAIRFFNGFERVDCAINLASEAINFVFTRCVCVAIASAEQIFRNERKSVHGGSSRNQDFTYIHSHTKNGERKRETKDGRTNRKKK